MPTWPTGTKAGTTNVDNPTDLVANARADIKQNIDNVNDIIDTFNISSPSNGDLLQYSTSTGKWEQTTGSTIGIPQIGVVIGAGFNNLPSEGEGHFDLNATQGPAISYGGQEDRWVHNTTGEYLAMLFIEGKMASGNTTIHWFIREETPDSAGEADHAPIASPGNSMVGATNSTTYQTYTAMFKYTVDNTSDKYKLGWTNTTTNTDTFTIRQLRIDIIKLS